jgi:hypothetical protein
MLGYFRTEGEESDQKILLTIDGVPVDANHGYIFEFREKLRGIIANSELYDQIIKMSFKDIFRQLNEVDLEYPFYWEDGFKEFYIGEIRATLNLNNEIELEFRFEFNMDNWKQLWSMPDHGREYKSVIDSLGIPGLVWSWNDEENILNGMKISFHLTDQNAIIQSEIESRLLFLEKAHEQTLISLLSGIDPNSILTRFSFPEEVKVPCEQYLLYFIQFLRDIGIEAISQLREEAGDVLFSVTPVDQEEALDNIKAALEIYLRLPSNPTITTFISMETEIGVQRLVSNILHLNSQLVLANATIQQKDILLQQQGTFIQQQQQLLSGQVLIQSRQGGEIAENKESLVSDIISIKKFDWKFIELDLPTLLRRLKQRFKRN